MSRPFKPAHRMIEQIGVLDANRVEQAAYRINS